MARIIDVAKYILNKCGRMSTMKLQKLCYYAQAWSLVWDDAPLFDEDFEAWANGPVAPQLFELHRGHYSVSSGDGCMVDGDANNLTVVQRNTVDEVLSYYADKNAQWLSTLTHLEDPWRKARRDCPEGMPCNNVITKEQMAMYYGSL